MTAEKGGKVVNEAEVRYMLWRSLGILLASGWDKARPLSIGVRALESTTVPSARIFHPYLLFIVNVVSMWEAFEREIVSLLEVMLSDRAKRRDSPLDVPEMIRAKRRRGTLAPVFREFRAQGLPRDHEVAAFVVAEYDSHLAMAEAMLERLRADLVEEYSVYLTERISRARQRLADLSSRLESTGILPIGTAREEVEVATAGIRAFVAHQELESSGDFEQRYSEYLAATGHVFAGYRPSIRPYPQIYRWRRRFARMESGLGPGVHVRNLQRRAVEGVYEVWCFSELCGRLSARGRFGVLQRNFLKSKKTKGRKEPTFALGEAGDAYFNYRGASRASVLPSKVVAESHVEWMIFDKESPRRSILMDTKYKYGGSRWRSDDVWKVLGYMNNFEVDRAVVWFSFPLESQTFVDHDGGERMVECRFGRESERRLLAVSLQPEAAQEAGNQQVLDQLIDKLWPEAVESQAGRLRESLPDRPTA